MPKKIRELKQLLSKAGFSFRPGKGSHTKWLHPQLSQPVVLSGKDGDDAKHYQEKDVNQALSQLEAIKKQEGEEE